MKKLVELKDIKVNRKSNNLLDIDLLTFYQGVDTFICGCSGSGKTTLLKVINNSCKYTGSVKRNGKIEVVFNDFNFLNKTIKEELGYNNLAECDKKIVDKFFLKSLLNKNIDDVSKSIKCLILICKSILNKPEIIFIDFLFMFMKEKDVLKVKKYLKKSKITLVCVSTNIEDALNYPYMIVINNGIVAIEGDTLQVLKEDKLLNRLGIGLPFYVDLSVKLKLYNLINDIYLTKEELENNLWKK